jgi:hypothetical protein
MSYRLNEQQLDELRAAVAADDIAAIHALLDAIFHHRLRLQREAQEQNKRQQRRVPWLPCDSR